MTKRQIRTERRKRERTEVLRQEHLQKAFLECIHFGGACLLGQAPMPFGTYPLGFALLCGGGRHMWSVLLGLIVAAVWQLPDPAVYICAYVAAALARLCIWAAFERKREDGRATEGSSTLHGATVEQLPPKPKRLPKTRIGRFFMQKNAASNAQENAPLADAVQSLLGEPMRLRLLTGGICAFVVGLSRILMGGFQYYDLFATLFLILTVPAGTLVYAGGLLQDHTHVWIDRISRGALLFSLVFAAKGIFFVGIPLEVILAFFFALYVCTEESAALSTAQGLLCGLAVSPIYAPAYLLASLAFRFFLEIGKSGVGFAVAALAMLSWSVYAGDASLLLTHLPATLLSGSVMTVLLRFRVKTAAPQAENERETEQLRQRLEGARFRDANDRFRGISDAFSALSEVFYNLSDRFRRPGALDLRRVCDGSFDSFCADCPNKTVCWGLEYDLTLEAVGKLVSALQTKGRVGRAQVPQSLCNRCQKVDAIIARINEECARLTGEMLRNNRTEIFAMDYESAADIINDALEEDDGEYRFDDEQAAKIAEYLYDAGVTMQGVTVYGNRRRRILVRGASLEHAKVSLETLRGDLGELCDRKLGIPVFESDGERSTVVLQAEQRISVIGAQNNFSADGGVSGDTVNLFSNKQDFYYALINDGMGAGKEAAMTSGLCSVFLEKMLRAGNRAATSLKMLNNMIRSRGVDSSRECSSTVDLLEIDLMTATASFLKSGAAPSFVVRGKAVHRLQAGTVPIGILGTLDVHASTFYLKEGDTVILVSDGILQDDADAEELVSYLSTVSELTPSEIVYHICIRAASREEHDDCSAIALRITRAEDGVLT